MTSPAHAPATAHPTAAAHAPAAEETAAASTTGSPALAESSETVGERSARVWELGSELSYGFTDLMRYHGPGFPGGVAHGFAALLRALPLLAAAAPDGRVARREVRVRTSFGGPGGRDAIELITRALTDGRFEVLPELARPERGSVLARYVFEFSTPHARVTCVLRDAGIVVPEFIELGARKDRSPGEDEHLEILKAEMRDRILGRAPEAVYDAEVRDADE